MGRGFFCGRLWQHKRVPGAASAVFGYHGSVCNVLPDCRHAAVCILTSKGVFAYDWDEAFDVTDFIIKLCLYNSNAGTEQLRRMLQHFSQYPFEGDAELCLQSAAAHLNMDADNLRPSYMQTMERFCKVTEEQVADLTDELADIYPTPLIVYYEEYINLLQHKITIYANKYE